MKKIISLVFAVLILQSCEKTSEKTQLPIDDLTGDHEANHITTVSVAGIALETEEQKNAAIIRFTPIDDQSGELALLVEDIELRISGNNSPITFQKTTILLTTRLTKIRRLSGSKIDYFINPSLSRILVDADLDEDDLENAAATTLEDQRYFVSSIFTENSDQEGFFETLVLGVRIKGFNDGNRFLRDLNLPFVLQPLSIDDDPNQDYFAQVNVTLDNISPL